MKKIQSYILTVLICFATSFHVLAQQDQKKEAIHELKSLMNRYQSANHLSFDIIYRYSLESQPTVFLDSLQGNFKMHGTAYSYSIDSTESLVSRDYNVMLFKEDKIMYLSSGKAQQNNPLSMPDSALLYSDAITSSVSETQHEKKVVLYFKAGSACRQIEYFINKKTGFITRMVSVVHASQLYDASVRGAVTGSDYALVEMLFNNYKTNSFDDKELDTSRYFRKEGKNYVTASSYESFKIFLGTPNL